MEKDRVPELEQAYRRRRKGFIDWARQATRSLLDAEDLVQEVFAKAMSNLGDLADVDDLEAWLFASLRNRSKDLWRRNETRKRSGEVSIPFETFVEIAETAGLDPAEGLLSSELLAALVSAIAELPSDQREVIEAQVLDGMTFKELSEGNGVSPDTLAARKRYAVQKLARALQEWIET